ncbi:ThuA domain-containing protein [Solirubrobacter phytolaccae]|uniref:ThuA domain-containing protein n=1 Tax=Solirubrobacter phytolaccae TaxID=1404360 RepID=A0A9X3S6B9_9ACTN|nr:ThuA domain-containing protein [Solirubrobacter phytolaccae]MDA0179764.1 ThuA domain-containing protein [Solirubrobacter phytolaccae]
MTLHRIRLALCAAATASLIAAAPAAADAGRVLVFTGAAHPSTPAAVSAIQALGAANDFTVDVTAEASAISDLGRYRAVAFVHAAGDVLDANQQTALEAYVSGGGGFVGIGETAKLEEGQPFFDTLLGLTGASRTTGGATTPQDVEFLDRVHPATRANPLLVKGHTDTYLKWTANPTGKVHTVARVRFGALPGGTTITNDAVSRHDGAGDRMQPQNERPVSWCRDVGQGRSFYTALGGTAAAYEQAAVKQQLLGALQWAAGMVRGNCKAAIDANYTAVRLTQTVDLAALATADDGRVFTGARGAIRVGDAKVAQLSVYGEQGLLGLALDPAFMRGRPYLYVQYFPFGKGEGGTATSDPAKQLGPGVDQLTNMGERRVSRFTYDAVSQTLVPGSERVLFHWMTPVYRAGRVGGAMDFDSAGNLYFASGDTIDGAANAYRGGYTNAHAEHTLPNSGGAITFGDARGTAANTNAYEGKVLRITPLADPGTVPGVGRTYSIPGADAPNGPNLFAPANRLAKPEVFAMGLSDVRSLDVDPKTDTVSIAWAGTGQTANAVTWGPAKTESATRVTAAGNYGWPYCGAGNRFGYRATLPAIGGGGAANLGWPDTPRGTVGGGASGDAGAFWDCSKSLPNDSPFNTGLTDLPAPKPATVWYGPQGGCYDFPRNANGVALYNDSNTSTGIDTTRSCPWALGGEQSVVTGGTYRRPAQAAASAWPAYWDGRWFVADAAGASVHHALLMDPATEASGGVPIAADSLAAILPADLRGLGFGRDGALYTTTASGVWRIGYTGGDDTPGPDPHYAVRVGTSIVDFSVGRSGGVRYEWTFSGGGTATGANVTHAFGGDGTRQATLTVIYADGERVSRTFSVQIPPVSDAEANVEITAVVPRMLGLTLGAPATFAPITPGVAATYSATMTASVRATTGTAALSIVDHSAVGPGHLVNGSAVMPQPLQARAGDAAHGTVSGIPLLLRSWTEAAVETLTVGFQQPVASTDRLLEGRYAKTLTFELGTTTP